MTNLWISLGPLIIGSAIVPIQIIITILLLRSQHGRITAVAWVAGMTTVRVVQGVVFGLLVSSSSTDPSDDGSTSPFTAGLLLVVGVLLLVLAARQWIHEPDPDAPPPKWLSMTRTMAPIKAFLLGAALLLIGPKFWVFTLSAIAVIGDADPTRAAGITYFLIFVVLAAAAHVAVVGVAYAAPTRSAAGLDLMSEWLTARNRVIVIVLGLVFGAWFVIKGLTALLG